MKILFLAYGELLSGVFPSQALAPMRCLAARGHTVDLLAFVSPRTRWREAAAFAARREACRKVFRRAAFPLHLPGLWGAGTAAGALRRALARAETPYDIIHARGPLAASIAVRTRGGAPGPKLFFDMRGAWAAEFRLSGGYADPPLEGERLDALVRACEAHEARAVRGADGGAAVTAALRDYYAQRYGCFLPKIAVLPCGAETERFRFNAEARERFRRELGMTGTETLWLYAGSAAAWQEPEASLRALAQTLRHAPTHRLLILTPDGEAFAQAADRAGVAREQVAIRRASHDEMPLWLSAADAALLLRADTLVNRVASPVKFSEYACAGLPVLLTEGIGDASSLVATRGWGAVAKDLDDAPDAAARLATGLPISLEERHQRGAEAARLFGWEERIGLLEEAYRQALEPPAKWIAHINHAFPVTTETFTYREVGGLRAAGVDIRPVSMRPVARALSAEAAPFLTATRYLPPVLSRESFAANLRAGCRHPVAWLRGFFRILRRPHLRQTSLRHRVQDVAQFLRAAPLAERLQAEPGCAHLHAQFADGAATTALLAAERLGLGFSFSSHTSFNPQLLEEKIARARFIASISRHDRAALLSQAPEAAGKIRIVRCGLPLAAWPRRAETGEEGFILSIGSLIEKKGHLHLLRACARLKERGLPLRCVIVGEGPERRKLEAERTRLGLGEAVALPGAKAQEEVRALLARARVFALACMEARDGDTDGIPVALLEAMALGVPIVTTRIAGIPELVEEGRTGRLVAPGDEAALATALAETLFDPAATNTCADAARARVEEEFNSAAACAALAGLFRAALA